MDYEVHEKDEKALGVLRLTSPKVDLHYVSFTCLTSGASIVIVSLTDNGCKTLVSNM
jgi:hypothetical protein